MLRISKSLFFTSFYWAVTLVHFHELSAYVVIPRSPADTTDRMNAGGDPPDRPGLLDDQRSPEYLDDWWGVNDYYYSLYGIYETHNLYDSAYNSNRPPYYPLPNPGYEYTPYSQYGYPYSQYGYPYSQYGYPYPYSYPYNAPNQYHYNTTRYYRPYYPL